MTALALGFIFVGSANAEIAELILTTLTERTDAALSEKWSRFMALGLALLYVGESFFVFFLPLFLPLFIVPSVERSIC